MSSLNPCERPSDIPLKIKDPIPPFCPPNTPDNLNEVPLVENRMNVNDKDIGHPADCNPSTTGKLYNDTTDINRGVVNRYPKSLKGTDTAMKELFSDISVLDVNGKAVPVPIIWATQEKAVAAIIQTNVRHDNSLVVDRINLPIMSIYAANYTYDESRYTYEEVRRSIFRVNENFKDDTIYSTGRGIPVNIDYILTAWTFYIEDMMQIMTSINLKVPKMTYLRVQGVSWEVPVTLAGISNNLDIEPGDSAIRVIKYQFTFTAQTYIPMPLIRRKAALKITTDYADATTPDNIQEILFSTTISTKDLTGC